MSLGKSQEAQDSFHLPPTMQTRSRSSKSPPTSGDDVNPAEDVNPNLKSRASPKAFWLPEDEAALIAFLLTKAVGNTADNHTFKDHVYIEAAKLINPLCQKGSEKTSGSCKSKYAKVCIFYCTCFTCIQVLTCMTS